MPEITRIETAPYNVPLKSPLTWGQGHKLDSLQHVLVTVTLSNDAQGTAEAPPRPTIYGETQGSIQHIIADYLAPLLVGQSIESLADIDALDASLHLVKGNHTAKGAVNIALHSALAQSQDMSLGELIGVTAESVPVSYIVGTGSIDAVFVDVAAVFDAGVRMFKVKIGKHPRQEMQTLQQLIKTFPAARFYVDANQCLDVQSSIVYLEQLAEMGVTYCEEPLPVHHLHQRQALRQQTRMPIIGDDSCFTVADVQREMDFDTVDIVNIKTARTGFSQSRQINRLARQFKKQVMVGSQASSLVGCIHAAWFAGYTASTIPTECTFFLKTNTAHDNYPTIDEGRMLLDTERIN